ncbi:hypothetical protein RND71_031866 [Anisodus tanguticus]|uniref:Uncharacterized protein n=1 Tax=Anisodus tanguticus TaxID=243964 RepID=A0AAE1RC41_9SOLA|nr:hypothetical protein RND71_031866 [Anisodus tanguticus]
MAEPCFAPHECHWFHTMTKDFGGNLSLAREPVSSAEVSRWHRNWSLAREIASIQRSSTLTLHQGCLAKRFSSRFWTYLGNIVYDAYMEDYVFAYSYEEPDETGLIQNKYNSKDFSTMKDVPDQIANLSGITCCYER